MPLKRALVSLRKVHQKFKLKALKNQLLAFNLHNLAFEFLTMLIRLKALKANKSRCFNAVGCSTRSVWFHKRLHHRCDLAFFVADS
ncbi:hypothetical protein NMS43_002653 [Vibrio cholerae]|nr:hypothetical protein [Vibrio cholerae]